MNADGQKEDQRFGGNENEQRSIESETVTSAACGDFQELCHTHRRTSVSVHLQHRFRSMSAARSKGPSPAQLAVRRLHACLLELSSAWAPLNTRLAALAQAAVNAHLQLGFAHSASMGALGQFSQLQERLESKMFANFQRQLDDIYSTFTSMVR